MSTKALRKHLELSGDIDDYARAKAAEEAQVELSAIERACEDLYINGFGGMSVKSRDVLFAIGRYASNEEANK